MLVFDGYTKAVPCQSSALPKQLGGGGGGQVISSYLVLSVREDFVHIDYACTMV